VAVDRTEVGGAAGRARDKGMAEGGHSRGG